MRLPEDRRAIDVSMSRLTLEAAAAALRAALLVAIASAILEFLIFGLLTLHSGIGLRFKIDGRCTLHSAEALGAWSARFAQRIDLCLCFRQTSPDPCRKVFTLSGDLKELKANRYRYNTQWLSRSFLFE